MSKKSDKLFERRDYIIDESDDGIPFDKPFIVASATDFTGLVPFSPGKDGISSYEDIFDAPLSPEILNIENNSDLEDS